MKINLQCGNNLKEGWVNIDSNPSQINLKDNFEIIPALFNNLDGIIQEKSCEHINFEPPLNVLGIDSFIITVNHWSSKLTSGGITSMMK